MQNWRLYSSAQTLQSCFYTLFIGHFSSVSLLFCFSIFCNLGPRSAFGGKRRKKSASEESPVVVWVGKGWRWPPSQFTHPFASRYLFFPFHFLVCLSPNFGAWSQANFLLKLQTLNFFRNEFAPQDWFSYLVLSCLSYKHLGQKLSVFSYQDLDLVIREAHIRPPGKKEPLKTLTADPRKDNDNEDEK